MKGLSFCICIAASFSVSSTGDFAFGRNRNKLILIYDVIHLKGSNYLNSVLHACHFFGYKNRNRSLNGCFDVLPLFLNIRRFGSLN